MFEDFLEFDIDSWDQSFREAVKKDTHLYAPVEVYEFLIDYYFNEGKNNYAEKAIEWGIYLYPTSSEILLKKGYFLYRRKRFNEAIQTLKNAYIYDRDNIMAVIYIALCHIELGNIAKAQKYHQLSLQLLTEIEQNDNIFDNDEHDDEGLEFNPYVHIIFQLNDILQIEFVKNDFEQPFIVEKKLRKKDKYKIDFIESILLNITVSDKEKNSKAYWLENIALCNSLQNKLNKSIKYIEKAIQIFPYSVEYWVILAILQIRAKKYEEALESVEYAIAIFPEHPQALYTYATILYYLKKYEKSLEVYLTIIELDLGDESEVFLNIGKCYENLNDYLNATAYYLKSYESNPENIQALVNLGGLFLMLHDYDMAHHYLFLAQKVNNEDPELNFNLADLMYHQRNYHKALIYINKALSQIPDEVDYILLQSEIYQAKGNINKSIVVLEKALNQVEENVRIQYRLAGLYLLEDRRADAYQFLSQAVVKDPSYISIFLETFPQAKNDKLFKGLLNLHDKK
ncbi:MAG: tetratricopeptide repeat protein [Bacteroidales bacterium]|nr:tetratricopeptide repeat protein [Bacteroidales bacterium]